MVTSIETMPILGESVSEGTIVRWLKDVGENVEVGEPLFEVSTDKVDSEVPARHGGTLVEILVGEGETALVGQEIAVLGDAASVGAAPARPSTGTTQPSGTSNGASQAPPLIEATVQVPVAPRPSGPPSRVAPLPPRPAAVPAPASQAPATPVPTQPAAAQSPRPSHEPTPLATTPPGARAVPHTPLRRAIGARMTRSLQTAAHTLVVMEADYEAVYAARRAHEESRGTKLTALPFVCRAIIDSIPSYPAVNSHVHDDRLDVFDSVHLGVAVDLDETGLIVPVVRDADSLRLRGLAAQITDIAERARNRSLAPTEIEGGTITVTNSGSRGSLFGRAVINLPQAVIVETDLVEDRVVGTRDELGGSVFQLRRRGYLSMSYDHRAFDGAYACGFLRTVCATLSDRDWITEL